MKKIIYILKKLRSMDFARFFDYLKRASRKHNKNILYVLYDMIKCSYLYGSGYFDYFIYNFPILSAEERATFVTIRKFNQIVNTLNDKNMTIKFDDKFEFNKSFQQYLGRFWCDIRSIDYNSYEQLFVKYKKMIIKPQDGTCGKGIEVLTVANHEQYEFLKTNGPFLLEEYIIQDENLGLFNKTSINTLRLQTLVMDNGDVILFSGVLRIGVGETIVDNIGSGGIYTLINEDGSLYPLATNDYGEVFAKHPYTNIAFLNQKINKYPEACALVCSAAKNIPSVRFVGWDVAMSVNGPLIIEGNQFPAYDLTQNTSISNKRTGDVDKFLKFCPDELSFLKQV